MDKIEFSLPKLIENQLSFEDYFLLYSVNYNLSDIFLNYVKNVKAIETKRLETLALNGWISFNMIKGNISFNSVKLTDKAKGLFPEQVDDISFKQCYEELKKTYPRTVGNRVLHLDNRRSEEIYKKTITKNGVIDLDLHKSILKCISLYVKKQSKSGGLLYLQALPTFLHQRNWEAYMEEASNEKDVTISDSGVSMFDRDNREDV